MDTESPRLLPALVLSAVVALVAALGSLLYMETASVKLSIPPHRLQADLTINAGPTGPDLTTQHLAVNVKESQRGTATVVQIPAVNASGSVTFICNPCPQSTPIATGTKVSTVKGIVYTTQARADIIAPTKSVSVAVRADDGGLAGNSAPGTVTVIVSAHPSYLTVSNPQAIVGGVNARTEQAIQQADFDAVAMGLTNQVTEDLGAALKTKALGMSFVLDGPPTLNLTSDFIVGDKTPTFTITIAGALSATAFSEDAAQTLLRSALQRKIPTGFELTSDPIQTTYQILRVSSKGDVAISGSAVGFIAPTVSAQTLAGQIRGMSVADARSHLQRAVPGSRVEIKTAPPAVYWLPLITKHITLTVVLEPAPATG